MLDLMIERAQVLEESILKDAELLLVRVGAGFAGLLAVLGVLGGLVDKFVWDPRHLLVLPFLLSELIALVVSGYCLVAAFEAAELEVPVILGSEERCKALATATDSNKVELLESFRRAVETNGRVIRTKTERAHSGIVAILVLVALFIGHLAASAMIKETRETGASNSDAPILQRPSGGGDHAEELTP